MDLIFLYEGDIDFKNNIELMRYGRSCDFYISLLLRIFFFFFLDITVARATIHSERTDCSTFQRPSTKHVAKMIKGTRIKRLKIVSGCKQRNLGTYVRLAGMLLNSKMPAIDRKTYEQPSKKSRKKRQVFLFFYIGYRKPILVKPS